MNVERLTAPAPACDAFVRNHPDGRLCFLPAWTDMAARCGGYTPYHLVARDEGAVAGVLPLVHVRSRLFGNRLVSQAFVDYGGPLAASDAARDALVDEAVRTAEELGCESIELRNLYAVPRDGLHLRQDKVSMWLPLEADPEKVWAGFNPKVRNQVRKAEKSGITAEHGGAELLDGFYEVYTARMRQLGTPCYGRRLMADILETFPEHSRLFVVRLDGRAVGGGLTTGFGRFASMLYASTLTEFNRLCPNNLLYWEAIRYYAAAGIEFFDFGRSTVGGGTHRFKKQWGPQQVDLHYQYWTPPGQPLAETSPESPKYRRKVAVWRKLPLWLTRWLGPRISRGLP